MGVIIVVVVVGEFIVGLQVVGLNINGLRFRMAAKIDCQSHLAGLAAKQERDGASTGRIALQGFEDGAAKSRWSKLIQQFDELGCLTGG